MLALLRSRGRQAGLQGARLCLCMPLASQPLPLLRSLSVAAKKKGKAPPAEKRVARQEAAAPAAPDARPLPSGSGELGEVIMSLRGVEKKLPGGRVLFRGVNLAFQRGAKIGVLGLNGAGKSSLLKILAGLDAEFDGVCWRGEGLRVGYLAQEPALDEGRSVHDNIMDGLRAKTALLERFDALSAAMGEEGADFEALLAEQAEVQAAIEAQGAWSLAHVVQQAKEALRVPPDGAAVATLSGGERRRVALCRLLLEQPELLLLDEPTNHLDATSVAWLERYLAQYRGTVLAVTHDRYFLDNVAGWILEVAGGAALPFQGNYTGWLERKAARAEGEAKLERKRARAMEEELAWIRQGPKGRQSKSKARIARFEKGMEEMREERGRDKLLSGAMVIPPGPRLGDIVLEVAGLSKTLRLGAAGEGGADKVLFKDLNFSLPPGGIVGIIGPNGAGKTSLLRCLMGDEGFAADAGTIKFGQTVRVGIVSQSRAELEGNVRVIDAVCGNYDTVEYGPGIEMPARQVRSPLPLLRWAGAWGQLVFARSHPLFPTRTRTHTRTIFFFPVPGLLQSSGGAADQAGALPVGRGAQPRAPCARAAHGREFAHAG